MKRGVVSVKIPDDVLAELEHLTGAFAVRDSRFVSRSAMIVRALRYGLPLLRDELSMDFVVPSEALSEPRRLAIAAKQIFDKGLEVLLPSN